MMVKAPTEMMMTMTRMWFSLVPDLPAERRETGLDWEHFQPSFAELCESEIRQDSKGSHQLQLKGPEVAGSQKVLAWGEDSRLFRIRKK